MVRVTLASLLWFALAAATLARAQDREVADPAPPRLVVLFVVDQMRADLLERFQPILEQQNGGLHRLTTEGTWFKNARHMHAITSTAPGHATLATGSNPSRHGVVSNDLPNEDDRHKFHLASVDTKVKSVLRDVPGASPRDCLVPALGDWMKAARPESKVVAVALKDRSAALLGGQHPDVCLYVDTSSGEFTTSTWYANELPAFAKDWSREHPASALMGKEWTARLPDALARSMGATDDDTPYEGKNGFGPARGATFPHAVKTPGDLPFTPFADERTIAMALAARAALSLGADDVPDLLCLSMSAADYVGHAYGPDSREVAEYYTWLDDALGKFLAALDESVGRGKYLLALSSDHGVSPIAELLISRGMDAGRLRESTLAERADAALDERFGAADWVIDVRPDIYLDQDVITAHHLKSADAEDVVVDALKGSSGIEAVYPRHRLLTPDDAGVPDAFRRSFNPTRSGDLMIAFLPGWYPDYLSIAPYAKANHTTHHAYDQRVPILLFGAGIEARVSSDPIATVDVAPTLAARVFVTPPAGVDGKAWKR